MHTIFKYIKIDFDLAVCLFTTVSVKMVIRKYLLNFIFRKSRKTNQCQEVTHTHTHTISQNKKIKNFSKAWAENFQHLTKGAPYHSFSVNVDDDIYTSS